MAENEFKKGDVVRLKSGGPHMTVNDFVDECVECGWFNEKNEMVYETFNPAILEKVTSKTTNFPKSERF